MNKKQLLILWVVLLLATSMIWFPGEWFGYIVHGYPIIRPDSAEFLVKIFLPLVFFSLLLLYTVRDKPSSTASRQSHAGYQFRRFSLRAVTVAIVVGVLAGFIGGYAMRTSTQRIAIPPAPLSLQSSEADEQFRLFCRREGYRQEVELLTQWLKDQKAGSVAILYNGHDAYSRDVYDALRESLANQTISVVFSGMLHEGEGSFFRELQCLASVQPEAIIFLGTTEQRRAFLQTVDQQREDAFWKKQRPKIKWLE